MSGNVRVPTYGRRDPEFPQHEPAKYRIKYYPRTNRERLQEKLEFLTRAQCRHIHECLVAQEPAARTDRQAITREIQRLCRFYGVGFRTVLRAYFVAEGRHEGFV